MIMYEDIIKSMNIIFNIKHQQHFICSVCILTVFFSKNKKIKHKSIFKKALSFQTAKYSHLFTAEQLRVIVNYIKLMYV